MLSNCGVCVGVSFLDEGLLVTSSIDQRLSVWKLSLTEDKENEEDEEVGGCAELQLVDSITHDVADVSSLTLYHYHHQ